MFLKDIQKHKINAFSPDAPPSPSARAPPCPPRSPVLWRELYDMKNVKIDNAQLLWCELYDMRDIQQKEGRFLSSALSFYGASCTI